MRKLVLALPLCALLASCGMLDVFGGSKKELSPEEKAARITINPFEEKLTPDPALAATTIDLAAATPATDWTQSGLTPAKLTGNLDAGKELKVDWRAGVAGSGENRRIVAAPVVKDNRVYVIDSNQVVTAFDADSGHKIWDHALASPNKKRDNHAVGGGLAIAGNRLIVASGYAYVAGLALEDGKELWQRPVESPMSGSPAILGNRAFVTSTNNEFYAIDTETGEIAWTDQAIAESARVLSSPSPAVTGDVVVVPYSSGELIAYLPANGKRLWQDTLTTAGRYTPLSAINDIAGHPTIQDGIVYAASHSGVLAAIDVRSGTRIWDSLFGSRQGPVIEGGFIFIVGTGGKVACYNKIDGKIVWVRDLPEFKNEKKKKDRIVWTGPLVASGRLILANSQGDVLALSPQNGETVGELKVGQAVYIEPIAASGRIFLLGDGGALIAIR